MKKNMKAFVYPMAIALIAVGLISCKPKVKPSSQSSSEPSSEFSSSSDNSSISSGSESSSSSSSLKDVVELVVLKDNVKIKNTEINTFDYTSLFSLKVNGESVLIDEGMIDRSKVINKEGTYEVICVYQDYKVVAHVTVEDEVLAEVTSTVDSITLKLKEVEDYDFISCFRITYNLRPVSVTSSMITSNVEAKEGTYTVTCSYKGASKSITVYVEENYKIEILEAYHNLEIPLSKMDSLDYKDLFYLFVDGVNKEITDEMIDHSNVTDVEVNKTYSVTLSYQIEESSSSKTISFKVVNDDEIIINSRNEVVYSNSLTIDVTSLFTIYEGGKEIEVTKDMISGEIIYDQIGTYTLTLNYKGQEKTCQVEVKKGVNILYHTSSRIIIKHGTNQSTYNFAGDFVVSVDGVLFNLNNSYVDTSKVDFSKEGEYEATIKIPYGENQVIEGTTDLVEVSKTITYVVLKNNAVVTPKKDVVTIDIDAKYDLFSNISCLYNNREKPLTSNKAWANDPTVTYAEVIGETPDFSTPGEYLIEIRTYPYGLDGETIDVSYILEVSSGIEIIENDKTVLFVGDSMYPREFFTLLEKGEEVNVTDDMIEGKIDFFKAGNYPLTLNYKNESLTITVSIIDKDIVGNYTSPYQTLVDNSTIEGSTPDEGYDNSGEDEPDIEVARPLKDMIISKEGIKSIDGMSVTDWKAIDANNFTFNISSFEYTMHYDNGVVICLPVNDTHMSFSDSNRPFVYVNSDLYTIERKLTIGTSSTHVFNLSNAGYSIDLVYLVNKETKQGFWCGLKTTLVEKNGADCYYAYEYGEFNPSDDFSLQVGNNYQIEFLGESYWFNLTSQESGQIVKIDSLERKYVNMSFNGSIDNKNAVLSFNENQTAKLTIDGNQVFSLIFNEYASLVNGKLDYEENIIRIYNGQDGYSYEFNLDLTNSTFTLTDYNHLFGLFTTSDSKYSSTKFFFDGYGKGVAYGLGEATYQTFNFTYQEENGLVNIDFKNVSERFKYKDGISFRLDSFRNVITIDSIANKDMLSLKFVNQKITDGIYVSFTKNTIPMMELLEDTKTQLLSYINITTKDGLVPDSEKENYLDLSYVDFNQAGFYSIAFKTEINNQLVTRYYGIHISEPLYSDHELVGIYQSSSDDKYTFEFNEFGNAIVTKNNNGTTITYEGAVIFGDDGFIFEAKDSNGNIINGSGKIETRGLVSMLIQGQEVVGGYFYTSDYSSRVTGFGSNVIREFKNQDESIYFYCSNTTSKGKRVTIDIQNGLTLDDIGVVFSAKDSEGKEVLYAKLSSWSSSSTGLTLADSYRGTYSNNQSTLSLDGFGFSETKTGDCLLDDVSYKYYSFNHEIFAIIDENSSLVKYVIINTQNKTFSDIDADYSSMNIAGTYGIVNFNGITDDYKLVIDEFGVGYFTSGSTTNDDYSESEDYGDGSDYITTSEITYYGRIISSQDNNGKMVFNFVGYTLSNQSETINITLTKLGDYFVKCLAVSEKVQVTKYMVSNYSSSVKYIGNERANFITTVMVNDKPIYLYYENEQSDLKIAQIEELNSIKFGTKGSIFNVKVGSNVVISEGMCTESSYTPFNGYVFANELKGTYKPSSGSGLDLSLDGFGYSMFDISGKATYGSELIYKQFKDNIIELIDGSNITIIELDITNKTYTILDSTYSGDLLGTFNKVTPESDNPTLTFDGYSRALYISASGTVYNCIVTHNVDTNEFSLNGTRVNDIYGDEIRGTGKLIGDGVIQFNIDDEGTILSYYFAKEGYNAEVFTAANKTTGIIYQITKEETNESSYYYAPSDKETLDGPVTILNEKDSPTSTFDEVGSIFSLSLRDEIILVARLENKTLNSGYILANLDERKTYTDENGSTLFTNGFGEGKTNLGTAILDNQTYFYYYNPSLDDTIVLYDENGNIEKYVVYYPDGSFIVQSSVLNSEVFDMNTYRNMLSPDYTNGYITFDSFGFFNIESYSCVATFSSDFKSFTFTGKNGKLKISGTGTILERGLFLLEYSGDQNACSYYSTSANTVSGGANGHNVIFQCEINNETKYLFAKHASYNKEDFIGYVNVELETPDIPLGTIGSIFKVYSLENELLVRGTWTGTNNGNTNVGFSQSDSFFGTFTNSGLGTITLDGYGKASRGDDSGTYVVTLTNGNYKLDLNLASGNYNYLLDLSNRTYAEPEPDLFKGLSFKCDKIATYFGETVWSSLTFDGAGGVKIIIYCEDDYYYPYCWSTQGKTGITGSYTFDDTSLRLEFPDASKGHEYIEYNFTMDSATNPTVLTAVNCNFESYYPGYVSEGMTFNLK